MFESRPLRGAIAGIAATVAMSLLMIVGMITGIAPMPEPIPKALAALALGAAPQPLLMGTAILAHLGYGAFWGGLLFGLHDDAGLREGLGMGAALWVVMGLVFLPVLGWGIFGTGMDPRIAVATLVLHLVYGLALAPSYEALPSGPPGATKEAEGI